MKSKLSLGLAASLIFIFCGLAFSQEATEKGGATPEAQNESETQWVWGEVVTSDLANKTLTVKYLDYETDQEKEITFSLDDKTSFENVKLLDDLKPKDAVSIDYVVGVDGKNVAKNISVEAPEAVSPQGAQQNTEQVPAMKPEIPAPEKLSPEAVTSPPAEEAAPQGDASSESSN